MAEMIRKNIREEDVYDQSYVFGDKEIEVNKPSYNKKCQQKQKEDYRQFLDFKSKVIERENQKKNINCIPTKRPTTQNSKNFSGALMEFKLSSNLLTKTPDEIEKTLVTFSRETKRRSTFSCN